MTNAFNWKGSPSIFTTGVRQAAFGEGRARSALATSLRQKAMPVALDKSSPYRQPAMQTKQERHRA